ncbi:MAG TPA: hypothetical protein VGG72_06955 [Bryobacteraceae bacterium]|jgi:hypothetical protein
MTPYDSVLAITKTYLGPAAESFLSRQCQVGLRIEASNITKAHFKDLAHTVEVAACRFIDRPKAEDMAKRIAAL